MLASRKWESGGVQYPVYALLGVNITSQSFLLFPWRESKVQILGDELR